MKVVFKFVTLVFIFHFLPLFSNRLLAQPGQLDSTFNGTGRVYTGTGREFSSMVGFANAVQTDGKLLVAGTIDDSVTRMGRCGIVRYNLDGSLDNSFGAFGIATGDFGEGHGGVNTLALTNQGRIIIGGATSYNSTVKGILARFNPSGLLDSSFGINGFILREINLLNGGREEILAAKVLDDEKMLVSIRRQTEYNAIPFHLLVKFDANGKVDSSFGTYGELMLKYESLWGDDFIGIQTDQRILVVGYENFPSVHHFCVSRYLPNGEPDYSFNGNGVVHTFLDSLGARANAVKVQEDGKIVVAGGVLRKHSFIHGAMGSDLALVRYKTSGEVDSSFGTNGLVITNIDETDSPTGGIALQVDGKILLGISVDLSLVPEGTYGVARYLQNGTPDSSFGEYGHTILYSLNFEGTCYGMQLSNNRIYLSGWANISDAQGQFAATCFNTFALQNDGLSLAPAFQNFCLGTASTTFNSDIIGSQFQWEVSKGNAGFINVQDDSIHSGSKTLSLTIENLPPSSEDCQYRCITDKGTSNIFTLQFSNTWTGAKSHFWNDAGNWSCGEVPGETSNVIIDFGPVLITTPTAVNSLQIKEGVTCKVSAGASLDIKSK